MQYLDKMMKNYSPKIEIISYYDSMINRVDIDIEECLKRYKDKKVLGELDCYRNHKVLNRNLNLMKSRPKCFSIEFLTSQESKFGVYLPWLETAKCHENSIERKELKKKHQLNTVGLWPESGTRIVDYLNQIRMGTIGELKKAQIEALNILKLNQYNDTKYINEMKTQLFQDKYYFQVFLNNTKRKKWIFNLFTFITDFYMSPSDIDLLEKLINGEDWDTNLFADEHELIFDEKMVLIGLLYKYFFDNLEGDKQFPCHVILVSRQDLLQFERINLELDANSVDLKLTNLSKLKCLSLKGGIKLSEINIIGNPTLQSLSIEQDSVGRISIRNLPSLRHFDLSLNNGLICDVQPIINQLPYIEYLSLNWHFYDFNLDSFANLKRLSLTGRNNKYFNIDLFKSICNRLEELSIDILGFDDDCISKLFYGHRFTKLVRLEIRFVNATKLEKKLLDGFPMLQTLSLCYNSQLWSIDYDSFSSLKHLTCLDLSYNSIEKIDSRFFSELVNLRYLNLSGNGIERIEENAFTNLKNLRVLDLSNNLLKELTLKLFTDLKWLSLENNRLSIFNIDILDNMDKTKHVYLAGNPISNKEEIIQRVGKSEIKFFF